METTKRVETIRCPNCGSENLLGKINEEVKISENLVASIDDYLCHDCGLREVNLPSIWSPLSTEPQQAE